MQNLSKSELNTMARHAQKITNVLPYDTGFGRTYEAGRPVSYPEMHTMLLRSHPWSATRNGNIITVEATGCRFTVELRQDLSLPDRHGQRIVDADGCLISENGTVFHIIQSSQDRTYGHYAVIDPPKTLTVFLLPEGIWRARFI